VVVHHCCSLKPVGLIVGRSRAIQTTAAVQQQQKLLQQQQQRDHQQQHTPAILQADQPHLIYLDSISSACQPTARPTTQPP
jgi:hypothetical protein